MYSLNKNFHEWNSVVNSFTPICMCRNPLCGYDSSRSRQCRTSFCHGLGVISCQVKLPRIRFQMKFILQLHISAKRGWNSDISIHVQLDELSFTIGEPLYTKAVTYTVENVGGGFWPRSCNQSDLSWI